MKASRNRIVRILLAALLCAGINAQAGEPKPAATTSKAPRYTFSWQLSGDALQPRGGSTRGAPVALDTEPSPAWKALQARDLTAQERDRRAILAMAGSYRVSFDFLEVATFAASPKPSKPLGPYQSWGTEKVYVDHDEPGFVSLVHILEMKMPDANGAVAETAVVKHWRQDWRYEPTTLVEYQGNDRWQQRALSEAERRGAWLQTVTQVDESPRYAGVGRWQHSASFSTWQSTDTWRPLPRREWSVRDDYQVLLGSNRHTIVPTGWTQEENNLKAVLTAQREIDPARPYLAREYGMARYERLHRANPEANADADADFAEADRYYANTRSFWNRVRDTWAATFAEQGTVTLRGPVDKLGLFAPLFERADQINENTSAAQGHDEAPLIRRALADMGVRDAKPAPKPAAKP